MIVIDVYYYSLRYELIVFEADLLKSHIYDYSMNRVAKKKSMSLWSDGLVLFYLMCEILT
jgi:hypothetical protein